MDSLSLLAGNLMTPTLLLSNPVIMITNALKKHVSPTAAALIQLGGMVVFCIGVILLLIKIVNQQARISWLVILGCLIVGAWGAAQTASDLLSMMRGIGEGAKEVIPADLGSSGGTGAGVP